MAITDLKGTKWKINSLTCTAGYGDFAVGSLNLNGEIYGNQYNEDDYFLNLSIGYAASNWHGMPAYSEANSVTLQEGSGSDPHVYVTTIAIGDEIEFLGTGEETTGLTDTNLISWLEQNATQVETAIIELKPFLTSIANAIRTKKGTTEPINAQNFASEIESIESGGGGLVGYTTNMSFGTTDNDYKPMFVFGILEDGTITTTHTSTNKYAYCYVRSVGITYELYNFVNCEATPVYNVNYQWYILKTSANGWSFEMSSGLGGD